MYLSMIIIIVIIIIMNVNSLTLRVEVYYKRRHDTVVFPSVRYD